MAEPSENSSLRLGLRENLGQFSLLVLINAFVGMMVGLERTVVPLIGEKEFGLASKTAIVSFIVSFGVTKAVCNLFAATISERVGRKKILVLGWLLALPVPILIIFANRWFWFDVANILLGMNQALCWSMTVIMKVDLPFDRNRSTSASQSHLQDCFCQSSEREKRSSTPGSNPNCTIQVRPSQKERALLATHLRLRYVKCSR
jgi:hypothetical protein